MAFGITDLKKGTIFELESHPYRVVDYNQKVVGRGGSIVNVRIKSLLDGRVLEKTFKGNESIAYADIITKTVQFLYGDNANYFFMDNDSYEQYELSANIISEAKYYLLEGDKVQLLIYNGNPVSIELPNNVYLKVTYSEDVVRGDTSSALTKPATLETGLAVRVPAFIKVGDTISVSTLDGSYRERQKN
jgi:elongation factor P